MTACAFCLDSTSPRSTSSASRRFFAECGRAFTGFLAASGAAQHEEFAQFAQIRRSRAKCPERIHRPRCKFPCECVRFLKAKKRRVSGFLLCLILTCGLTESRRRFLHIQNVVGHLKSPPNQPAKSA